MHWIFSSESVDKTHLITGEDAAHITKSLRMSVGEMLTICDSSGVEHLCIIKSISPDGVLVKPMSEAECPNEPSIDVTLFAALIKGDKTESVIQKSVEIGVRKIIPMITDRCIPRPETKSAIKKAERFRKIAAQAAMQSHRAIIPEVSEIITLPEAAAMLPNFDKAILFYEGGGAPLKTIIGSSDKNTAILTGPEGGFDDKEVELLTKSTAVCATLGKRILRAETAPIVALSAIMFHTGNLE